RARLEGLIEHQHRHGFSKWAVLEREGGRVIGDCGLLLLDGGPDVELGFHFRRTEWGRGYATEAAAPCLEAAFVHLDLVRVVAVVMPGNAAAVRVLERMGMRPCGRRPLLGRQFDLYEALRPPPLARAADSVRYRARW